LRSAPTKSGSANFTWPARRLSIQSGSLRYTSVATVPVSGSTVGKASLPPPTTNGVTFLAFNFAQSASSSAYVLGGAVMPAAANIDLR